MLEFTVIDTTTNEYPDLWKIATTEEWAKHLMYCDMEGFAISEDGALLLLDECGNVAYCPADRFKVVYTVDVTPVITEERADVAREIFEEIKICLECEYMAYLKAYDYTLLTRIEELKKKYTEGE